MTITIVRLAAEIVAMLVNTRESDRARALAVVDIIMNLPLPKAAGVRGNRVRSADRIPSHDVEGPRNCWRSTFYEIGSKTHHEGHPTPTAQLRPYKDKS